MSLVSTGRQIGRTIKNATRMKTILTVFAKHGFANILERIKLGKFIVDQFRPKEENENRSTAERVRSAFEELGPTFVKLGQVLASRPDLIPQDFIIEFSKLHDQAQALPIESVLSVLKDEFGESYSSVFEFVDEKPLGSASIAQVHLAKLRNGESVVLKIQRPGIVAKIQDDLNVLFFLAELVEEYIPESRNFKPVDMVQEYFKTLQLETNFIVEANNIRRFEKNFENTPRIHIPKVYLDYSTEKVLVLEALDGKPLSSEDALLQPDVNPEELIRAGLNAYLKMVFVHGLFHGDLHAGNLFVLKDGRLGLIDFGVVGRLNYRTQNSIAAMLIALSKEDYERLAFEYLDLAPFNDHVSVDHFARDLRTIIAPYYGLTMKNVNVGKLLLSTSGVAAKHHLVLPTELMLFFKSLVGIESIGRKIQEDFDFLAVAIEFAGEISRDHYSPDKLMHESQMILRESKALALKLPRHLHQYLRKINSPDYYYKTSVPQLDQIKNVISASFNLLFLGMIISTLIFSATLVHIQLGPKGDGIALFNLAMACLLGVISFINYIKK